VNARGVTLTSTSNDALDIVNSRVDFLTADINYIGAVEVQLFTNSLQMYA